MKNLLKIAFVAATMLATSSAAQAFNLENHSTIAYIAEQHMTPKARANFRKAFDNHPLLSLHHILISSGRYISSTDTGSDIWWIWMKRCIRLQLRKGRQSMRTREYSVQWTS